ncbi:ATP-binding protein [Dactylosporangium siamense]|uniref:STAS domain-containing protein n=1 Tax=Dactylosporangium siamense TaxID=685454 RepID=A0A919PKR8_9ACTN|nr:ATP-binding protein [Dactylosporangium siamense]GIG43958.1 hypothetical protein Dsi01nite_019990 [Dactylosporangium siamense]
MTGLTCFLERDFPVCHVTVRGMLGHATAPQLRAAVLKALADRPELVLIDVSGLGIEDDITLTAFPALVRQGEAVGVPVMLCGPSPSLARRLGTMVVARQVPAFASRAEALAAHADHPAPAFAEVDLPPGPAATAGARELVDRFCGRWGLEYLADDAALIVTELVANVVLHARTACTVTIAVRQRYLHIAVRDQSRLPPRRITADDDFESGRGLLVVEGVATSWGFLEAPGGKVVWATLRMRAGR